MTDLIDGVRTDWRSLLPTELLDQSPRALLGVTQAAAQLLEELDVRTVFDLATSVVFTHAVALNEASGSSRSLLYQHGVATSDMVREAHVAGKRVDELPYLPVAILQAVPEDKVAELSAVLDVATVRDLALYPPFVQARRVLERAYFPENAPDFDPERPADLVPKTGEYPTERVQYTTLLLDEIEAGGELVDVHSQEFAPIDLTKLAAGDAGFRKVARGALMTFTQSWFAQGVTLGQLLHSTALAPGESTRIAVVDWSRRSRAGETELISEQDELTNEASHNRSISEVTSAVADEAQGGFSHTSTSSTSSQSGMAAAAEMSAPLGGLLGGPSGSLGTSSSTASASSSADSYSSSWGHRSVGSSMAQNVNDRTHQHAHSSRSRRASVVKEVAQSEHENVSTRVIANYNHMHALTVQYYEVVQVYRVDVTISKVDQVVFIPIKLLDFTDDALIRRFQAVLVRAALSAGMREALANLDTVEIAMDRGSRIRGLESPLGEHLREQLRARSGLIVRTATRGAGVAKGEAVRAADEGDERTPAVPPAVARMETAIPASVLRSSVVVPAVQALNEQLWKPVQAARLSSLLGRPVLRADSTSLYLPTDCTVEGIAVTAGGATVRTSFRTHAGATVDRVDPDAPLALSDVATISLTGGSSERDVTAEITLTLNRNGVRFPFELPGVVLPKGKQGATRVATVRAGGVDVNVRQHLQTNAQHYSQAVMRSLTAAQIALLLSGYSIAVGGRQVPVAQVVEPVPVRYVGNYLAFRMNSDPSDRTWAAWLEDHGIQIGYTRSDLVPLGTGGTFAEAILGRSNAAEKLDMTRFWNWQDSPIPLQPTDIAAIQTGSRATAEDTGPGQLSPPIINITTPTSLPDPVGTAAVLGAVQNGGMFRDMSGLAGTLGLAQAALQASSAGAATAGQQAGTNMDNLLKANTERQRIAAQMITDLAKTAASAYTGMPAGGSSGVSGGSSHSTDGAKVNYFDKTKDTEGVAAPPTGSGGAGAVAAGSAGHSTGGTTTGNVPGQRTAGAPSDGYSKNPAALAATWGDSAAPSTLLGRLVDKVGDLGGGGPEAPALGQRKAWPKLDPAQVLARIDDLAADPAKFHQGGIGLCTAAAFFHHVLQIAPEEFRSFAKALYGAGLGFLGKLKVDPSYDLRNVDFAALSAKFPGALPPQADWMVMSALRDSANWFFDYEGAPDESFAMSTSAKEMAGWYEDTGFYSSVAYSDDTSLAAIKGIKKTAGNHVALWIDVALLQSGSKATHMITLESAITIDEAADKAAFKYWTWGQPIQTLSTTCSRLKQNYLGVITAKH